MGNTRGLLENLPGFPFGVFMLASLFSKCQLKWMVYKAKVAFTNPDKDLKAKMIFTAQMGTVQNEDMSVTILCVPRAPI